MVIKTQKAFSLVEMIIALLIVAIAGFVALPVFTIQKPNMPQINIRGQYACWRNSSDQLMFLKCDERACAEPQEVSSEHCDFTFDARPAHFFVAVVGSGSTSVPGQLITDDNPSLSDNLKIDVPLHSTGLPTTISSGVDSLEYSAASGYSVVANGLNPTNIKKCNLLTTSNECYSNTSMNQESCNVISYSTSPGANPELKIEVTCSNDDSTTTCNPEDYGYCPTSKDSDIIEFSLLQKTGNDISQNVLNTANTGNITYKADKNGKHYEFNFELFDSGYTLKSYIPGEMVSNANAGASNYKTAFKKLLENINNERASLLTQTLIQEDNGNMNKNGAVLILW